MKYFKQVCHSTLNKIGSMDVKNFIHYDCLWEFYITQNSITSSELKNLAEKNASLYLSDEGEDQLEYSPSGEVVMTNEGTTEKGLDKIKGYTPTNRYICEIPDCTFVGGLAVPFYKNKVILEPFGGSINGFMKVKRAADRKDYFDNRLSFIDLASQRFFQRKSPESIQDSSGIIFPLVHWYKSYYHWIADYLPKLRLLEKYESESGNEPTILVREKPAKYRIESLEVLGYSSDRITEWNTNEQIRSHAVFSNHRTEQFEHSREDYRWLRDMIFSNVDMKSSPIDSTKVYISRQADKDDKKIHNDERQVINFEEFKELITSYGFEIVKAEEYSFKEQVQIFNSAEIIMGPHGGGLTNLMFAEDPLVIELFPNSFVIPLFSYLCDTLNFDYQSVIVDSKDDNLQMDIGEFDKFLSSIERI